MTDRSHYRSMLAGTVAALALLPGSGVMAQEATELEEIVVEGAALEENGGVGPVTGVVARTSRTGMKSATELTAIPQAVSVVGRTEIDDMGAQNVGEALRYTPGVLTQPFGTDSDTNWLFIRGFQATQTGAYMDGLQLFGYAFGGFYVDTFGLERVEVLKGPASVLYGGSNPGGIVNYVSKRPDFSRNRYVESGINDAGTGYVGFDISDVANENVALRMNGRLQGGEGYSDFQKGWRGFIAPSLTIQPEEGTSLTFFGNYTHIDETHNGDSFLPYDGTVVDRVFGGVNYGRIDRDANFTEPSVDFYERQQGSIGYELEHTLENDWTVRSNARFGVSDIDEQFLYADGWASATELNRVNFAHQTQSTTFLIDNQLEGTVNTGAVEHRILGGIDYKFFNIDQV
jgi:iron complex outermembrane recepter protein